MECYVEGSRHWFFKNLTILSNHFFLFSLCKIPLLVNIVKFIGVLFVCFVFFSAKFLFCLEGLEDWGEGW